MGRKTTFRWPLTLILVSAMLAGCGGASATPKPVATPTAASTPTAVATPTPDASELRLEAPEEVVTLWTSWNGKYVMYAHRDAGITKLSDLSGKDLFMEMLDLSMDEVMNDAGAFTAAAGVSMNFVLQNNVDAYKPQFLTGEESSGVGFMTPSFASQCGFPADATLIPIVFVPAA